ncbi:MAG: hypothetical protein HY843_06455, partial [Bdellovibrio sp.]|nr:hypothetical protein [Bdellovibrio sp.]
MFKEFIFSFVGIFVALDVVGAIPFFISLSHKMNSSEQKKNIDQSMVVALIVALVFVFLGNLIFKFLGIQIFDFK